MDRTRSDTSLHLVQRDEYCAIVKGNPSVAGMETVHSARPRLSLTTIGVATSGSASSDTISEAPRVPLSNARAGTSSSELKAVLTHRTAQKTKRELRSQNVYRMTRLGLIQPDSPRDGFRGGGESVGSRGDGGGEKTRWLKLKRDEVDESGPLSWLYDAAFRRLIRGGEMMLL